MSTWHKRVYAADGNGSGNGDGGACMVDSKPAISFYDVGNDELCYIQATDDDGTTWANNPVVVDSAGSSTGLYSSLAVVGSNPAISYQRGGDLYYVQATDADGATWGTPTAIDTAGTNTGLYSCLMVANGQPMIAYVDGTSGVLKVANYNGSSWSTQTIVNSGTVSPSLISLAVINGNPAVAYSDSGGVKFLRASDVGGTTWSALNIVTAASSGSGPALVQASGGPVIVYQGVAIVGMTVTIVAQCVVASNVNGTSWGAPSTIDTAAGSGTSASIGTFNGNPAVAYQTAAKLYVVRATSASGSAWASPQLIDDASLTGYNPNFLVVHNKAAVAYKEQSLICFTSAANALGETGGFAVTLGPGGSQPALHYVTGRPAMAFMRTDAGSPGNLIFERADDTAGNSFSGSQISVSGNGGPSVSMVVVEDKGTVPTKFYPCISYFDTSSDHLLFIRAADEDGSDWIHTTPQTVESSNAGAFNSMAIIDGLPAIAYFNTSTKSLLYRRATNATGTSWSAAKTIDTNCDPTYAISLTEVNSAAGGGLSSYPAVCYTKTVSSAPEFEYKVASDIDGTSTWANSPTALYSDGGIGPSLAVIDNNPAVSYYVSGTGLVYSRAANVTGSTWSTSPTVLDASCSGSTCLREVYAHPAIAYTTNSSSLAYIRSSMGDFDGDGGTPWETSKIVDFYGASVGLYPQMLESATQEALFGYSVIDPASDTLIRFCRTIPQ